MLDAVRCHPDVPSGRTCFPSCPSGTGSPKIIPLGESPHPVTQKHRNIKAWPCGPIASQLWLNILAPEFPWGLWAETVSLDLHHHSTSPSVCSYICPLPSMGWIPTALHNKHPLCLASSKRLIPGGTQPSTPSQSRGDN